MKLFQKFFRRPSSATPQISAPLVSAPKLPEAADWFMQAGGFIYPDWGKIGTWITETVAATEVAAYYQAAVRLWLHKFQQTASVELFQADSPHFTLLTTLQQTGRKWVLQALENARRSIIEALGPLAWESSQGKLVVIILPPDLYESYITPYSETFVGVSSGMKIESGGFVHIAAQARPGSGRSDVELLVTLAHELTHVALHKLRLPRWLDEALAMSFEEQLSGREIPIAYRLQSAFDLIGTKPLLTAFADWWTEERLQGFWNGRLWNTEGDATNFCYELSRILFRLLRQYVGNASGEFRGFVEFAREADGGEAAAQKYLGLSLGDIATAFLGPGHWQPQPRKWRSPEFEEPQNS